MMKKEKPMMSVAAIIQAQHWNRGLYAAVILPQKVPVEGGFESRCKQYFPLMAWVHVPGLGPLFLALTQLLWYRALNEARTQIFEKTGWP